MPLPPQMQIPTPSKGNKTTGIVRAYGRARAGQGRRYGTQCHQVLGTAWVLGLSDAERACSQFFNSSFSNDICTTLFPYPYFVHLVRIDIPSSAGTYCFLRHVGVTRVCVRYGAIEYKMCRLPAVLVWRVVRIAMRKLVCIQCSRVIVYSRAISPRKHMVKTPRSDFALCFFP